ncbi:MAG: FliI/YscN family ATPase [Myxococcota bacterium]|jgi:type III secretion protein N (ATPase)
MTAADSAYPDRIRHLGDLISERGRPARRVHGTVSAVKGLAIRARLPGAGVGDAVTVSSRNGRLQGEVVGFDGREATVMLTGDTAGVSTGDMVTPLGRPLSVRCGNFLLGRVLDGLGSPIDGRPIPAGPAVLMPLCAAPPDPLLRRPISEVFITGVRAIDGLITLGRGQRVGLFAGSGVGKSTLLGNIARHASSDVNVICLVGERGREVGEFIRGSLGPMGLLRSVVICATGDRPPMLRLKAACTATAIAEYFRDTGKNVLLMMDSVTRLARAQREIGLAAGEPPARQGYPPSVFRILPELMERAGNGAHGTMTAIYTVLVASGDMEEPIADEVRGILDGHVVMSRELAHRNHYPAIDVPASLSRLMSTVVGADHRAAAGRFRSLLSRYESGRDLISIGAYRKGADPLLDEAVAANEPLCSYLAQGGEPSPFETTVERLLELCSN